MYDNPWSSRRIFCKMKMATVLESSEEISIMFKQRGTISVVNKKLITSGVSFFTNAPMTPKLVSLKYSNERCLAFVDKNGYKYNGKLALKNKPLVRTFEATHWRRASALQTLFETDAVSIGGLRNG